MDVRLLNFGFDDNSEDDDDFVALVPPPEEKYDPEWRLKPPEPVTRCSHCKNWISGRTNPKTEDLQIQHILNGCRTFQNQGRYEWRHTAVLNFVDGMMDRNALRVYSNLPDRRTESDGTVPEQLLGSKASLVRGHKPDLVFFSKSFDDESTFTVGVLEITLPWDGRVEPARAEKQQKNAILVEALSAQTRTPVRFLSFEIGSFHQRLSEGTKASMKELYSFTYQDISFKAFRHRIVKLAEFASFQLYATRSEPEWLPFSPYLELPQEMIAMDEEKDSLSSGSEATSLATTNDSIDHSEEKPLPEPLVEPEPIMTSGVADISQEDDMPVKEVVAFSVRTKFCIYGVALTGTLYVVYYYWHVLLMCLFCLFFYELWDKVGHRFSKASADKKSD